MPFEALDYYAFDSLLSEDEIMIRDTVRAFVDEQVIPHVGEWFEKEHFPAHLVPLVAEMGLLGPSIPETYGGAGLNSVIYGLICQELERGDSGLRSFVSVQGSLCMYPIFAFGTEDQKKRFLPDMAAGKKIGCFGLTEPNHGSDPGGMETRAVLDGDHYILNGAKMWITNGTIADIAIVWAKLDGEIRGFLVEKGTPGFSAPEQKRKYSLRASVTSELIFQDCRIPKDNLLPNVKGLKGPLSCLTQARYGIAWGAVGTMMAVFDEVRQYGLARKQFGSPLAGFQLYQTKLAQMATEITKAQLLALQLGRLKDKGTMRPQQVSMAKRNNVYWALECARVGRDMLGANGITLEFQTGRHMVNMESVITYEGTHDIHTLILGADLTGINAFAREA